MRSKNKNLANFASLCGKEVKIYQTNYNFREIFREIIRQNRFLERFYATILNQKAKWVDICVHLSCNVPS